MSPHIGWPQAIYLAFAFLGVCVHASANGKPRKGHYDLGAQLIGTATTISVLWWGGFFG